MSLAGLRGEQRLHSTEDRVAEDAARWVHELCNASVQAHGHFSIALAGGGIAQRILQTLASEPFRSDMRWDAWRVYFGDERAVSPDDEQSNYRMARGALLDHVDIDPGHVHRMPADAHDLERASLAYSHLLAASLPAGDGAPRFDCILLGIGENGHTASLFPGTPALDVSDQWATKGQADYAPYERMTLTFASINAAAAVGFAVTGASKRTALRETAAGRTPSARVAPHAGALVWFLDSAAANDEGA